MSGSTCPAACRWLVVLRSGAAMCIRWGERVALVEAREPDEWGEPKRWKTDRCFAVDVPK